MQIAAVLAADEPVRLLLVGEGDPSPQAREVLERCRRAGVPIRKAGPREMKRMAATQEPDLLALVGPDPAASLDEVFDGEDAVWLLTGVAYPGNAGFAIRTAEVSGAAAIVIDAPFDHAGRRQALRAAMRADRFFPVLWAGAADSITRARRAGHRIIGVEDSGAQAPWEARLDGATLFVIGGEAGGVPPEVLEACDLTVRIPMRGFIPSYNLQAAMAIVAGERLRQLQLGSLATDR
jgi:TrmH family RNA methyltransferase